MLCVTMVTRGYKLACAVTKMLNGQHQKRKEKKERELRGGSRVLLGRGTYFREEDGMGNDGVVWNADGVVVGRLRQN